MVNLTRKHVVGAHYGLRDWLLQRVTAVVMIAYTVLFAGVVVWNGGLDHATWRAVFAHRGLQLASFLFMLALLWHAWVGVRNILMDYVKPVAIRLALQATVIGALAAYAGWTIQILWGAR
jgi:succinate dehydrogenase / fumarate reductase membrane anchor subunit